MGKMPSRHTSQRKYKHFVQPPRREPSQCILPRQGHESVCLSLRLGVQKLTFPQIQAEVSITNVILEEHLPPSAVY